VDSATRDRPGIDQAGIWRHRTRDGSIIEVEIRSHRLELGSRRARLVLATDVTVRLEQERKIARLSRIRAVTGGISSAMLRLVDREALLREACRVAATAGVFPLSWVTARKPGSDEFEIVAWHSEDAGALDVMKLVRSRLPNDQRPAYRAALAQRPVIINDVSNDPRPRARARRAAAARLSVRRGVPAVRRGQRGGGVGGPGRGTRLLRCRGSSAAGRARGRPLVRARTHRAVAAPRPPRLLRRPDRARRTRTCSATVLDQFILAARENQGMVAVVVLDLEHFTRVN
jgi:hypothetical protein